MPVLVRPVMRANGESEVVGIVLSKREDSATLQELFRQFKAKNPRWTDIRTALTDKNMAGRDAVRHQLPHVSLLLCLFHVPRAMGRKVTTSKMNLPESQLAPALSALRSQRERKRVYTVAPEPLGTGGHGPLHSETVGGTEGHRRRKSMHAFDVP